MKTTVEQYKNNIFNAFHVAFYISILLACTLTLAVYGKRENDELAAKNTVSGMLHLYFVLNWILNGLLIIVLFIALVIGVINIWRLIYTEAVEAAKQEILASGIPLRSDEEQV